MSRATLPVTVPVRSPSNQPSSSDIEAALRRQLKGEVRFDSYSRHLFSTDASMYSIEPIGVVFPYDVDDVIAAVETAIQFDIPVLPRGGGTSLAGQTEGRALVLDFSKHMNRLIELDPEERFALVQPGLVQDDLNRASGVHGLLFAPDTSTGNRATIGGMIGNNSCGSRSARYGMTIDHVDELTTVLSDGSVALLRAVEPDEIASKSAAPGLEGALYREIPALIAERADVIRSAIPKHWRRSGGYRLERMLPEAGRFDLSNLVVGSEGTLAITVQAKVRLVPRPKAIAALVGHFDSISAAIEAAPIAMELGATAVELVDRMILDLARRSPVHAHLTGHLEGNPGAILWVEFYGDSPEEAEAAMERLRETWSVGGHGYALLTARTAKEQKGFRELRKAGQGLLLNAGHGRERSLAFVEDTAVDPLRLADFTREFAGILEEHGLRAGFYGHASAGTLHVRPFMDLTRPGEVEKMRTVAEQVLVLVQKFGGMNSSEHGDGLARGELNRRFFGDEFYAAMVEVKRIFDPDNRLNPGKKVAAPALTEHLREPALGDAQNLETHFHFDFEGGMRGAANRCMRIGACRKSPGAGGVMCPSYMATRDEEHSTRGRANALVRALSANDPAEALADPRIHEILDLCLECKACQTECPLAIDMAAMKSETLAHYYEKHGVPFRTRLFGHARTLNRWGSAFAPLSNLPVSIGFVRALMERALGIDRRRPLPRFRRETLSKWFADRPGVSRPSPFESSPSSPSGAAGSVRPVQSRRSLVFLADSFSSFTEPEIGRSAIELLESAGWDVSLADDVCCGRALISKGLLKEARETQGRLIERLAPTARAGIPIVGCEPSCVLTLKDELLTLRPENLEGAEAIARQTRLADELLADALEDGALSVDPASSATGCRILFHGHCHQKAAGAQNGSIRLLQAIPGAEVEVLDAGCCGMAGSFGFEREHYDLSMSVGSQRLFPAVKAADPSTLIAATGVSCRQQIEHGGGRVARHPIEIVRSAVTTP